MIFIDGSLGTKEAVAIVPNVATLSNPGVESFQLEKQLQTKRNKWKWHLQNRNT